MDYGSSYGILGEIINKKTSKLKKLIILLAFELQECENQIRHVVFMHIHMAEVGIRPKKLPKWGNLQVLTKYVYEYLKIGTYKSI